MSKRKRPLLFFIVIGCAVVFFPLCTVLASRFGLDYLKGVRQEMKELGKAPLFKAKNQDGQTIDSSYYNDKLTLIHLTSTNCQTSCEKSLLAVQSVYNEFNSKEEDRFLILSFVEDTLQNTQATTELHERFVPKNSLANWMFLPVTTAEAQDIRKQLAVISKQKDFSNSILAIVDYKHDIRGFYNAEDAESVNKMVRHISVTFPVERPKAYLKRKLREAEAE